MNKWNYTNGSILQVTYNNLDENSLVFDIGACIGSWGLPIYEKYKCNIYMFEPISSYYNDLLNICKDYPKIKIFPFGLSNKTELCNINLLEAASSTKSTINGTRGTEEIKLRDIVEFIQQEKINHIHLLKINIEGGEYDVLPRLIESNMIGRVANLQIQFHDFIPNAINMRNNISKELYKTHRRTWNMDFIWENWEIIYDAYNNKINNKNLEPNLLKFIK